MMIVRMVKDLTVYLKSTLKITQLSEEQKSAFKFFNGKYEEWRRLLNNLYMANILDKYSLTEERQLYLQYMAHNCLTFVQDLKNDVDYNKTVYEANGSKQKLKKLPVPNVFKRR